MKIQAYNLKDAFKTWKLSLIVVLIGVTFLGLLYLIIEAPDAVKSSYDPLFGYVSPLSQSNAQHRAIVGIACALPIIDIALLIFIVLFAKWEKDAGRYGFSIDGETVHILCEGQQAVLNVNAIERFEVLPKNCEPTLFKSKWTGVSVIFSNGVTYKLYYLKNMEQARQLFQNTKTHSNSNVM